MVREPLWRSGSFKTGELETTNGDKMRTLYPGLLGIACCAFVLNSAFSFAQSDAASAEQKVTVAATSGQNGHNSDALASTELPDSPDVTLIHLQDAGDGQQGTSQSQGAPPSQPVPSPAQQNQQRPVGTAAAEAPKVSGITAAQPAGVAIAPAKQRRVRTIVLRVGAIVGAGAALGTVIALTAATPSKPPGAH